MKDTATISTREYYELKKFKEQAENDAIIIQYEACYYGDNQKYDGWHTSSLNRKKVFEAIDYDGALEMMEEKVEDLEEANKHYYEANKKMSDSRVALKHELFKEKVKSITLIELLKIKYS